MTAENDEKSKQIEQLQTELTNKDSEIETLSDTSAAQQEDLAAREETIRIETI